MSTSRTAFEPHYRADINALAEELRREHGAEAFEIAVRNAREYIGNSAWKNCALWLQVVNRLNAPA
jgi:hypothetical protein